MGDVQRWTPRGERVVWTLKPHPLFIILRRIGVVAGMLALAGVIAWALAATGGDGGDLGWWRTAVVLALVGVAGAVLVWSALVWANQEFVLTEERAIWASGVVRRLVVQVPLERVQNVAVYRSLRERLFGLGTIGLATAGTDTFEIVWPMLARPAGVMATVTDAVKAAAERRTAMSSGEKRHEPRAERATLPVIGLAGGIGSGKSEVARIMAARGCAVIDSDREARAALDLPEVRSALVRLWGDAVVGADGRIDRKAVAAIVFGDEAERRKLEAVVHPIVQRSRREAVERARRGGGAPGTRGVVVDAPLLFEVGADRDCDAVVFVDAPREVRVARVRETRGWDEGELARRESAQMPLEEKRRRSGHIVVNTGSMADLEAQVEAVLRAIESPAGARAGGPAGGAEKGV